MQRLGRELIAVGKAGSQGGGCTFAGEMVVVVGQGNQGYSARLNKGRRIHGSSREKHLGVHTHERLSVKDRFIGKGESHSFNSHREPRYHLSNFHSVLTLITTGLYH